MGAFLLFIFTSVFGAQLYVLPLNLTRQFTIFFQAVTSGVKQSVKQALGNL